MPCSEPRYFTTRKRRVAIWSTTRWSSRITQSATYSSSPCRVRVPSPRSAVMTAVTPLSFEPAEEPAQLRAQDRLVGQAGKQRLDRVEHHALGADRINGVVQPDEQRLQVILAGLLDFAALHAHELDGQFLAARPGS